MVDVERILNELLVPVIETEGIKNAEVKIKPISTQGANYTSTLHLITIKSSENEDLELFAKVACVGGNFRKIMQADRLYRTERFVYQELRIIYERLQTQNEIPENERLIFPKFYACGDKYLEETVILENLIAKGYTCYDRFEAVTWDYASAAIAELAKLHALSYAFAENDPEKFAKVVEERQMTFDTSGDDVKQLMQKSEANALEAIPEESWPRLKEFLVRESGMESFEKYYTSFRRPVLVHGDFRASNILHKIKDGKLERLIPVDYQTLITGSPLCDLLYFIFSATDGKFRKLYYKQLIDHYYTTFADFLKKLGLQPTSLYTREHFDEDLKKNLPFGLLVAIFLLPVVLVEAQNAPKIDGDATLSSFAVKPNDMFRKRFLEIFNDFTDWRVV